MNAYQVWIRARDPKTLEVVAAAKIYEIQDRAVAEVALERAGIEWCGLYDAIRHVAPFGALISTEMVMPGTARVSDLEMAMMTVELVQMRKAALAMAKHILATPARGDAALCEAWRAANDIVAADAIASAQPSQVPA